MFPKLAKTSENTEEIVKPSEEEMIEVTKHETPTSATVEGNLYTNTVIEIKNLKKKDTKYQVFTIHYQITINANT